jgi:hypothetical protein
MTCQNLHQESLNNLAVCFSQTGDQDLALSHFTECLEIMRKVFFFKYLTRPGALAFIDYLEIMQGFFARILD